MFMHLLSSSSPFERVPAVEITCPGGSCAAHAFLFIRGVNFIPRSGAVAKDELHVLLVDERIELSVRQVRGEPPVEEQTSPVLL